jgi:hypothetical protein
MRFPTIRGARFPTRSLGPCFGQPSRKRRRLSIRPTPRHLEFFAQALVLAAEPVTFILRPHQILTQALDLADVLVDDLPRVTRGGGIRRPLRHAPVIPNPRTKYKSNHVEYAV